MKKIAGLFFLLTGIAGIAVYGILMLEFLLNRELLPTSAISPDLFFPADLSLVLIFGFTHSAFARSRIKNFWAKRFPGFPQRLFYVFVSGLALFLLGGCWTGSSNSLWDLSGSNLKMICYVGWFSGWALTAWAAMEMDAMDLGGFRAFLQMNHRGPQKENQFRVPFLYRFVRHPLYLGFMITWWSIPVMTADRLIFSTGMSLYVLLTTFLEERDMVKEFGVAYLQYSQKVPRLVPFLKLW